MAFYKNFTMFCSKIDKGLNIIKYKKGSFRERRFIRLKIRQGMILWQWI